MKKYIKYLLRKLWLWAFKDQINGIGLDHHIHSNSWVVLSLTEEKQDYVTFLELKDPDIKVIQHFLSQFKAKQVNIDRNPYIRKGEFLDF